MKGCANLETICDDMKQLGVKYLTVYAFSTENWKRSREEVEGLMRLFRNYLKKCIKIAERNKMRVRVIGDITACLLYTSFGALEIPDSFPGIYENMIGIEEMEE